MDFTIARKEGTGAIIWSEDQKQYIKNEYVEKDRTLKELSAEFQVQPQSIRNLLRKLNVPITNKKIRDYPRNSKYFNRIDTHEKAYWLGMFYADGTVSSNSNKIALSLKDKEHVQKFQKSISAINNKIVAIEDTRFSKECVQYIFSINDKELHDALVRWGCVPNKTYTTELHFPNIPKEFYYDFIRGYFDGDGCIMFSKSQNKYKLDWCGNFTFLTELKTILGKEKISLCQNSVSKITYNLRISGKQDVTRILQDMYKTSTEDARLIRKYEIVQKAFSQGDYVFEPVDAGCE